MKERPHFYGGRSLYVENHVEMWISAGLSKNCPLSTLKIEVYIL